MISVACTLFCRYEPYVEERYKESLKTAGKADAVSHSQMSILSKINVMINLA